jgi:hypothetical protein
MPRILIAWELGSGLGHVGPLRPVAEALSRRGHVVAIAVPNVELCRQAFAGTGVEVHDAPRLPISEKRLKVPCTYSDVLHDCGYSLAENLSAAVQAWRAIIDDFQPDLLLADHSPTALLASRGRNLATATIGISFACPADISPLPSLRREIPTPHWAAEIEQTVLANMNAALTAHDAEPLERVSQIFGETDHNYLLTLETLDHYRAWREPSSDHTSYWPAAGSLPGVPCDWPTGSGVADAPRVFVYLRRNEPLLSILRGLAFKKYPTICYAPHLSEADVACFTGSSVNVSTRPVDVPRLAQECSVAVLHGGNTTACQFLLAGVPMLILPTMLEQQLTGERIEELRVGRCAPLESIDIISGSLEQLIEDSTFQQRARQLSNQLNPDREEATLKRLADDIEELVR